jgi:cell division inhibitor SepF
MAGAMRKMAVYLGLVEDEADRFDEYGDAYADAYDSGAYEEPEPRDTRRPEPTRPAPRPGTGHVSTSAREDNTRTLAPIHGNTALAEQPQVQPRPAPVLADPVDSYRITTLHPRTYNDARAIGEHFRDGTPVITNLSDMGDADAKRLVDFAAGLVFGLRGSIERVTAKVFLLSPANVEVTAEDKARIAEAGFFNQS